jgi:two-component system phosphate regulon sensor histidine kinase PhoR
MKTEFKKSNPLLIFYILSLYIMLQFAWWTYMLANLNDEVYVKKIELARTVAEDPQKIQQKISELNSKLFKKKLMIIGEGSVFILILFLGLYKTKKSLNKELKLAEQQKNFLLSITHELKSPVAAIKLYLQTILKRDFEHHKKQEIINKSIKETERLNNLIENLLFASRIDSEIFKLHKEITNLKTFIENTLENIKTLHQEKYSINLNIDSEIFLNTDKHAFSSIIINLVENAIKYSAENTQINIEGYQTADNKIILRVIDQGIGIPDEEKNLVFDRFYRIGNEETRSNKGTGLGLFIVKSLLNKLQGQISILNNKPVGSIFELTFHQ